MPFTAFLKPAFSRIGVKGLLSRGLLQQSGSESCTIAVSMCMPGLKSLSKQSLQLLWHQCTEVSIYPAQMT